MTPGRQLGSGGNGRRPAAPIPLISALGAATLLAVACGGSQPIASAAPTAALSGGRTPAASTVPAASASPGTISAAPTPEVAEPVAALPSPLLVDDAATRNPALVDTMLRIPAGFAGLAAHTVRLPSGFSISLIAAGLRAPRFMAFDSAGNLLVADQRANAVYRYPAAAGAINPAPTPPAPLLQGLKTPSSVALWTGPAGATYLYVGETNQVSRYRYDPQGAPGAPEVVVPDLPTGGHSTRTVVFGPDGKLYLGVGSSCNICDETDERRAAISRYNPDGSGRELFARGLRNAVGLAFQPGSGSLWATVNERDNQGDEIPPDLVTIVQQGQYFGWPTCRPPDAAPQQPGNDCGGVTPPTVGIQAHSAPLGLVFYEGAQFPEPYRGGLFVAQHGSWNRQPPAPPKLLQVEMRDGRPAAARDFATGWQTGDDGTRWGRPVGLVVAPDGSLIVSDDQSGLLYRVSFSGTG